MVLSELEQQRYTRQMLLDGWGQEGQMKLKDSTVFVAGAGGLGSPVAIYLAVAGVGRIRICDYDNPELSNLNRQILHSESRIGINKAISAKITLWSNNPLVEVKAFSTQISDETVDELVGDSQIIMDCMDNFPTRYVLNRAAIRKGIPLVHGSIWGLEGRLSFIHVPETPCLQCIFPEAPPREVFPVLGATPGVIGCLQTVEAIKYLVGIGENLKGKMLVWDGVEMDFLKLNLHRNPHCPVCGNLV